MPELNKIKEIIDIVYPVGSVYISVYSELPLHFKYAGSLMVGKWELIDTIDTINAIEYHFKRIE